MTNKEKYCKYIKNIKRFFRYCIDDCLKRIYHFILFLFCIEPKKEENKSHELLKLEENSDIKNLKENLNRYLKDSSSKGFVISIKGNWGVGKTFFWNIYAKENLDEKKYVYISLFGINKLDEIKTKILNKISKQANIVNKTKGFFGSSRIVGVDIGAVISIFGIKNFKDIVVCFDDFERLSPNLNISEVLGVISELKEQYNCKIVIINNNDQLEELDRLNSSSKFTISPDTLGNDTKKQECFYSNSNNHGIFEKYIEKIVDLELLYKPTVEYQVNLLLNSFNEKEFIDRELMKKLFGKIKNLNKETNLRLMQKYIFTLKLFREFLEEKEIENFKEIKDELQTKIFVYIFGKNKLNNLIRYYNLNDEYIEEIIEKNLVNIPGDIKVKFNKDIKSARENIKRREEDNKKYEISQQIQKENEEYKKKIEETYSRYISDLDYDKDTFIKEFYELLKGQENIIEFTYFNRFTFFIKDCLIVLDKTKEDELKKFYIVKSKIFFDSRYKNMERYFFQQVYFLDEESRNELIDYYNDLIKGDIEIEKQQINQLDILDSMVKIIEQNSNNTEERMLDNISKQEHKKKLKENSNSYFKTTFELMEFLKDSYKLKNLENFYNTTLEIYKDLYKDKDYKYRDKIRLILKDFGIDTKELDKVVEESGKE